MKEEKVSTVDVDAILANEELVKKLAAKVLDIVRQKPDSGVVCQGYYCDMAKEEPINELWAKKLNALGMKLEEGLIESVAAEYPISADELDQIVTEIKTSSANAKELSGNAKELSGQDLSRAVSKVLADNEMMRRKGSMKELGRQAYPLPAPCGDLAHRLHVCSTPYYPLPAPCGDLAHRLHVCSTPYILGQCALPIRCGIDYYQTQTNYGVRDCPIGHGLNLTDDWQQKVIIPELIRIMEAIVPKMVSEVLNQLQRGSNV